MPLYATTHMLLVNAELPSSSVKAMMNEMNQVEDVKSVLGLESLVGTMIPREMLTESALSLLCSEHFELLLMNSEYKIATDEANASDCRN